MFPLNVKESPLQMVISVLEKVAFVAVAVPLTIKLVIVNCDVLVLLEAFHK